MLISFANYHFVLIKGGQAKFIDLWRCWTPNQLPLLKGNLTKVLFMSAPSTGKTALMEAKALQCIQNGLHVVFLLPFAGACRETKTLLTLKMQEKARARSKTLGLQQHTQDQNIMEQVQSNSLHLLGRLKSIRRQTVPYHSILPVIQQQGMAERNEYSICSLRRKGYRGQIDFEHMRQLIQSETYKDAAIFADELLICEENDLESLTAIAAMCEERTIWLAITFINNKNVPMQRVKSRMNDFYFPELLNPVRNSAEIIKYTYPSLTGKNFSF